MEIKNFKKRKEVIASINEMRKVNPRSESEPERMLYEKFLKKGFRPQRQYPISGFFVDMAFPEKKIAIEYDGKCHRESAEKDEIRHKAIRSAGWNIARIRNDGFAHMNSYSIYLNERKNELDFYDESFGSGIEYAMNELVYLVIDKLDSPKTGENSDGFSHIATLLQSAYQKIEKLNSKAFET